MHYSSLLVGSAIAGTALAKTCVNMTVPVTVSTEIINFIVPSPADEFEVIAMSNNITSRTAMPAMYTDGKVVNSATYNISARYCKPATSVVGGKNRTGTFQFLTHGIGFEKSYWDFAMSNYKYSYTNAMLAQGYSTFAIDRLGTGLSSHPAPAIPQLALEAAIIIKLTDMLRAGSIPSVPAPKKVIHVGHSYGSALSNTIVSIRPNVSDAIILTGFSHNNSFIPAAVGAFLMQPAAWNQPARFGNTSTNYGNPLAPAMNLPLGYMTWINVYANQFAFFAYPYFDKALIKFAEATKQPYSYASALTLDGFMTTNFTAPLFTGPVQIISGMEDKIYCGSNCTGILEPSAAKFPNASSFVTYKQPHTGHAVNLHHNSTGAYKVIASFLSSNGF